MTSLTATAQTIIHTYGYPGIFAAFTIEMLGAPIPGETSLTIAGLALSRGVFAFLPLWLAASLGNIVGSSLSYGLGVVLGHRAVPRLRRLLRVSDPRWNRAEQAFTNHRIIVIFTAKFVSIVRLLIPFLAGVNRTPFWLFTAINGVSALIWSAVFLLEGMWLGKAGSRLLHRAPSLFAVMVLFVALGYGWHRQHKNKRRPT